ncbi:MAG: Rid family detoxifying hydrolase [Terriglobales bacterium]
MPSIDARSSISTAQAPSAIGPYVQAVRAGGLIFCSGQIALDPASGNFDASADVARQSERVLQNLSAVLSAAGSSLAAAVKTTVFLADMSDFAAMNEVYARYFPKEPPARSTVAVRQLPKGAKVEMDVIALA